MMRVLARAVLVALLIAVAPTSALADARTDYLVRLLQTSEAFRVRAQAALSLGRVEPNDDVIEALGGALRDEHPAVRAAAAASLEQLRDPSALDALRGARSDRDAAVRTSVNRAIRSLERVARSSPRSTPVPTTSNASSGSARYYVGVGMPGSSERLDRDTLRAARSFIQQQVSSMEGVVLAPDNESNADASRILRSRRLTGYYLDSSIVRIETQGGGTRAVVSVIVNTYPGRDMRVILQGAATVQGATGGAARQQAVQGALTGALRRLPQALAAGDARDGG